MLTCVTESRQRQRMVCRESCGLCFKRPKNKQDYVMCCCTGLRRWNNESAQSSLQQLKRRWWGGLERSDIRAQRSWWPRETHTTQLMHVQDLAWLNLLHNTVYSVCLFRWIISLYSPQLEWQQPTCLKHSIISWTQLGLSFQFAACICSPLLLKSVCRLLDF